MEGVALWQSAGEEVQVRVCGERVLERMLLGLCTTVYTRTTYVVVGGGVVRAEDPAAALRGEEDAYTVFGLEAAKRNADPRVFGGVAGHCLRQPQENLKNGATV